MTYMIVPFLLFLVLLVGIVLVRMLAGVIRDDINRYDARIEPKDSHDR